MSFNLLGPLSSLTVGLNVVNDNMWDAEWGSPYILTKLLKVACDPYFDFACTFSCL